MTNNTPSIFNLGHSGAFHSGQGGQLDEALAIRQEQELPVFEQLGDVRELLVARTKIALLLWEIHGQARQAEVKALLCESLQAAKRLRIPEAETIEGLLQQLKLSC